MPLGLYLSVPFCRTKCTYCNFASDVFSRAVFERYVQRVCSDIEHAAGAAHEMNGRFERSVDSVYLGGGTPTVLDINQLQRLFVTISQNFDVPRDAEITVECAPGTLTGAMLSTLQSCGVNRVSLGVQSFVDVEAASVGRLHKRETALDDIARLRSAGIADINVDLIAGLPHQTEESWQTSLAAVMDSGVAHVSVYMLEVDEDSRLGRELIAGGTKYHAHFVPDEDLTADLYSAACERLESAGIVQYEISNFARPGHESHHNLKYWTRQPYLGFGVDAHSMLLGEGPEQAVRFATPDSLEGYLNGGLSRTGVGLAQAVEEMLFLGLRLNRGIDLRQIVMAWDENIATASQHARQECNARKASVMETVEELAADGLLTRDGNHVRLTARGRLLSNEVFQRFLGDVQFSTKEIE